MELKKLSEQFPWDETYRRLCGDPPEQSELSLEQAKALIVEQRESQLEVLARGMYGPRLVTGAPPGGDDPEGEGDEPALGYELPRFEFNDPDRTARRFMRVAAQVGARLRPWTPERLAELDPADALLGRLLRLLAVAEAPAGSSGDMGAEWEELKASSAAVAADAEEPFPLGPVLGPMFALTDGSDESMGAESSHGLIHPLVAQLGTTDRLDALAGWAGDVVEAGARQIAAISPDAYARGLSIEVPGVMFELGHGGPAYVRDIVLAGPRERNRDFLEQVRELAGVDEEETDFIHEPAPGIVRVRAWSAAPLQIERLTDSADEANAKVIEVAEEKKI